MLIKTLSRTVLFIILSTLLLSAPAVSSPFTKLDHKNLPSNYIAAQLNIELGGDNKDVIRRLRRAGYSQIKITKTTFLKIRAEACLGPDRYKISVKRIGMRIQRGAKIGNCRVELPLREIIAKLRSQGYSRIDASEGRGGNYAIRACDRGQKFRLVVDRFGEIVRSKNIGRCRRGGDFADIRLALRDEGFNRIRLIERARRLYVVEACQRGAKYRLRVNRRGVIKRERRIGRCTPPIKPRDIEDILARRGFDRIRVTDRRLPGYKAEACRRNTRLELLLNRYGDIMDSNVVGDCEPPITKAEVLSLLRKRGVNRMKVLREGPRGFLISGCYRLEKIQYRVDPYGDTVNTTIVGRCSPPPRLNQVLRDFRDKRLKEIGIFVEGCTKGRLMRYRINRFGQVIKKERIGRCR